MFPIYRQSLFVLTLILILLMSPLPTRAGVGDLNQRVKQEKMGESTTGQRGSVSHTGGVGLNFRNSPWGTVQSVLPEGADLQILARQGDWLKVKRNGATGFVHKNYVNSGSAASAQTSGDYTVQVSNDSWAYLNVRSSPYGKIIGKAYAGDKMQVVGRQGDWLKVKRGGSTAWVHSDYMVRSSGKSGSSSSGSSPKAGKDPGKTPPKPGRKPDPKRNLATYYSNNYSQVRDAARRFWPHSYGCAAFASTALKMAGYPVKQVLLTNDVEKQLKGMGWQAVTHMNQLKPGDVVFTDKATSNVAGTYSHVYVYQGSAGPGYARVLDNYGSGFKRNIGAGGYSRSVIAYRPR